MQAPQRSTPSGAGKAQVRQRRTGWAKRVMQVSHTGSAGQWRQMAQRLGSALLHALGAVLTMALAPTFFSQCAMPAVMPPMGSIYCRLLP